MLNEMIKHSLTDQIPQSDRDFYGALRQSRRAFIFECKRRSPSEGTLCQEYPIVELAKTYEPFCDVISVLTNQRYFDGSLLHLKQVRDNVKVPVLCKDIIVSSHQVILARHYGADAILLMLSVLDDETYLQCRQIAEQFNMGILTEVVTEQELFRAKQLNAKAIAVNHRDLNTLIVDKNRVIHLANHFPTDTIMIAASGINSHQDVLRIAPFVNGFLIGSILSKSQDPAQTLRELIYGPVKICGLTQKEDSLAALEQGATYGGLIFVPSSKRCLTLLQAQEVMKGAKLRYVGVFAMQPIDMIVTLATNLQLFAVQLHGDEPPEYIKDLRNVLPLCCQIWLAISPQRPLPVSLMEGIDKYVIDNMSTTQRGGTGNTFEWQTVRHYGMRQHCLLAGGINPTNVISAKQTGLWGLDINSGIECGSGVKDPLLLKQLFLNLRGA
ncbi:MAG: bifunctional indole-3-glycerol-phosphate synthase TrpC/phosphoribosylanthranilate isomerase TrpF [Candidatus Berkiella sp.]